MTQDRFILHLGLGAFHRAHQAAYLQRLHDRGDKDWHLVSGNIRPAAPDPALALAAQGNQYTLETVAQDGHRAYQQITAIAQAIPYDPQLAAIIERGADPATRIISFTVTETGYFLNPDDSLDLDAADVCTDMAAVRDGRPGSTIYGALAAILRERRQQKAGAVTLLCCDNLRHNGSRFRRGLLAFLDATDIALSEWVRANTTSPCTMVDRITPRTPRELTERVRQATGHIDQAPVMSELFMQWVIEDDFCNGSPDWPAAGVEMVASVAPYEEAKIRILNATHSCLAWAGALRGHRHIHECMRDARIAGIAHAYVTGAVFDCLRPSPVQLERYRDQVFQRFASDAIADTVDRVLADSFAKLTGFVLPTIAERLSRGDDIASVAALPALFLQFLLRWHRGELDVDYVDQGATIQMVAAICDAADPVAAFCSQRLLWYDLADAPRLQAAVRQAMAGSGD